MWPREVESRRGLSEGTLSLSSDAQQAIPPAPALAASSFAHIRQTFHRRPTRSDRFAAEAAWSAGKWEQLERTLGSSTVSQGNTLLDFNVGIGHALLALRRKSGTEFKNTVASLRDTLVTGLSPFDSNICAKRCQNPTRSLDM